MRAVQLVTVIAVQGSAEVSMKCFLGHSESDVLAVEWLPKMPRRTVMEFAFLAPRHLINVGEILTASSAGAPVGEPP